MTKVKSRKCWYFIHVKTCPACGSWKERRERRYDNKPKDPNKRREIKEVWNYCDI